MAEGDCGLNERDEPFKPCFIYDPQLDVLTWLEEDDITVAAPVSAKHAADVLWNAERTRIIGVQIWGARAAIKQATGEE